MWFLLFLVLAVPSSNGQDQTRIVTYDDHAIRIFISGSTKSRGCWLEAQGPLKVTAADLYEFGINEKGITLFYNAGFHHTAKDVEPEGRYFFKYSELKDYLKPGSIVSQFIK